MLIVTGQFWNVVQGSQGAELGYYGAPLKDWSYPASIFTFWGGGGGGGGGGAQEITKNYKELPLPPTLAQALEKHPVKNLTIEVDGLVLVQHVWRARCCIACTITRI